MITPTTPLPESSRFFFPSLRPACLRAFAALVLSPVLSLTVTGSVRAQTTPAFTISNDGQTIAAPPAGMDRNAWLAILKQWRQDLKAGMKYDSAAYARPDMAWTQRSYVQSQMMAEDRYFYDPVTGKYTVNRYLDDLTTRYGGIDSVLVWVAYPNIGIDDRNQHDLLRDMPGGLAGVKRMVDDFHLRGVRVLFAIQPWDIGTHRDPLPLKDAMARDFKEVGADGVNGDTMSGVGLEYVAAAEAVGHPMAFEPELAKNPFSLIQSNIMSWGYWPDDPAFAVDKYKWFEARHLTHVCERWNQYHLPKLQAAFLNGDGFESWENIWGIWNGLTPRAAESLRRMATIQRGLADLLISADWEPFVTTLQPGINASIFPTATRTAWLLINSTTANSTGQQLTVPYSAGVNYYNLWNGTKLTPQINGATATLSLPIEGIGFGAILSSTTPLSDDLQSLMTKMAALSRTSLAAYSADWQPLLQQMVAITPTAAAASAPEGMVSIPAAANYHFEVHGVEIEGWGPIPGIDLPGIDVQMAGENAPMLVHKHDFEIKPFYMDKFPITNEQFKAFLQSTGYYPTDDYHFLKDWTGGTYRAGWAKKPVTWVSLEDARAYAAWAGKRLPHEWEWQYAAQGTSGRLYPWGTAADPTAQPTPFTGNDLPGPSDVDAFPKGASPFGVMDLVGNVWQWTDEYQDEHTRAAIIRGGSYYRPGGAPWYFPQNTTLDQHGKYLLMSPGRDRAGTLGFRCVQDGVFVSNIDVVTGTIPLTNASFESTVGYNGGATSAVSGWTAINGGTYGQVQANNNSTLFSSGVSGNNVISLGGGLAQTTATRFVKGVTYTLTVDAGQPLGTSGATGFIYGFRNESSTANDGFKPTGSGAAFVSTFPGAGLMQTYSLSYTATADDAGKLIKIGFYDYFPNNPPYRLDNVTLSYRSAFTKQQTWRQNNFGTTDNTGTAADSADPDGDGVVNLLEYAFATDPLAATQPSALPISPLTLDGRLKLTFLRARPTLTYTVQGTSNLTAAWTDLATNPGIVSANTPVVFTDAAAAPRFLRLKITAP